MNQNQQDIDEHLLLQYLLGNADKELSTAVEAWLNADKANRRYLDRLESLWLEAGKLSPAPVAVDVDAAWLKMSARIEQSENVELSAGISRKITRRRIGAYLLGAAAMIIVLVGIYSIYRLLGKPVKQIELTSGTVVVHDTLPDGTLVALNKNSTLVFPEVFSNKTREVKLTGTAFFEVKHNKAHPFVVHAGNAGILVLGTTFSISMLPVKAGNSVTVAGMDVSVSVTEGRVLLFSIDKRSGDTAALILNTGENGILNHGAVQPVRTGTSSADRLFWANRTLDFSRTPLSEVFGYLRKYYSANISFSDPAILDCRISATFVDEPVDRILSVIAASFNMTLNSRGNNFHLTGHGCSKENN
ncbi:MAG: FecR domain-containing protein [Bacteroidetes bacterium]|nr:FecR domain-containing protein [Bacteroidota bacterium]